MWILPVQKEILISDVGSGDNEDDQTHGWEEEDNDMVHEDDKLPAKLRYNGEGKQHELLYPPPHETRYEKNNAQLTPEIVKCPKVSPD